MSGGNGHIELLNFSAAPRRVVSLVPSMTQSLIDFGAAGALVGITDYCPQPPDLDKVERLGGTRDFSPEAIVALKPDLVIANQEENSKPGVESLEAAGIDVWLTFPKSVEQVIQLLHALARLFRLQQAMAQVQVLEVTLDWMRRAEASHHRLFCPIWYQPAPDGPWWMTFNSDTYAHDVLRWCGGDNVFATRQRRYPLEADLGRDDPEEPGERDVRYPRVTLTEIIEAAPEIILLPDEPFAFGETERNEIARLLADTPAVSSNRVHLVDGTLIAWPGTRTARALAELPSYLTSDTSPSAA
jgi:ABC-type Fe3+-hydroxamate transport system substrate-binding protein